MESIAKHQARENDRISALPNELCCHILSFLPTLDAVRTTVLSTRWKKMWTSLSNLDFDDERDLSTARPHYQYYTDAFITFVERVLLLRDSTDIHRFRLAISHADDDYCSRIEAWICTALQRNVVELDLDLFDGRYFHIPQSVFMCKTLKVLKVGTTVVCSYHPPTYASFPSLKFLKNDGEERKHGCYCPFVEDLTIIPVAIYEDEDFNVYAPKLKTLKISLERLEWSHNFCMYAPELKTLCLEQVTLSTCLLECPESLDEASIILKDLDANEKPDFAQSATSLLAAISNVKDLFLSAHSLEAGYFPVFGNLTKLKLVLHESYYSELLPGLLKKTPNLEHLALEDKTKYDGRTSWVSPIPTPLCLKSHLKTISIKGFKARDREVVLYLRKHGSVLEEMAICQGKRRVYWKKGASV